jgi:hypothetical protein
MFSHGWLSISRNIQLMVLPDTSGKRKEPRKCHSQTLAYLSFSASVGCSGKLLKLSQIHVDMTPEVLLKYKNQDEMKTTCNTETNIK